jgi:uncharacterized membrane protein
MIVYVITAMVWIVGSVAFWEYVLYPMAITEFYGSTYYIIIGGLFWIIEVILVVVLILAIGIIRSNK